MEGVKSSSESSILTTARNGLRNPQAIGPLHFGHTLLLSLDAKSTANRATSEILKMPWKLFWRRRPRHLL